MVKFDVDKKLVILSIFYLNLVAEIAVYCLFVHIKIEFKKIPKANEK